MKRVLCAAVLFAWAGCADPSAARVDEALSLARSGDLARAGAAFEAVLAVDPEEPRALYNLALLRHAEGNAGAAQALMVRFLDLHPDDALGRVEHARMLAALEQNDRALAELQHAVRLGLSEHAALRADEFHALRPELAFVMLDVTVAQRNGVPALSRSRAAADGALAQPSPRIRMPGSQDELCDPAGATVLVPPRMPED